VLYAAQAAGSKTEIFVQPFPMRGLRTQVTSTGGESPVWRGDGKEILYRNVETIYSLRVEAKGDTLHTGQPEASFRRPCFREYPIRSPHDGRDTGWLEDFICARAASTAAVRHDGVGCDAAEVTHRLYVARTGLPAGFELLGATHPIQQ
jgi:hypothetical protein